jgi:fatty acid desaturase
MTELIYPRDYSLTGRDAKYAEEHNLSSAQWYQAPIPRKRLKELMQRSDGPAIRPCDLFLADAVVGSLSSRIWRALWLIERLALA